eukprot:SAG11_NODE_7024_length_1207_cov_0.758123_3_plen_74_part_01
MQLKRSGAESRDDFSPPPVDLHKVGQNKKSAERARAEAVKAVEKKAELEAEEAAKKKRGEEEASMAAAAAVLVA